MKKSLRIISYPDSPRFPVITQEAYNDCGIACFKMLAAYNNISIEAYDLRKEVNLNEYGLTMFDLKELAELTNLNAYGVKLSIRELFSRKFLPGILHWNKTHFVVVPPQKNRKNTVTIIDPFVGKTSVLKKVFKKSWYFSKKEKKGYALIIRKKDGA